MNPDLLKTVFLFRGVERLLIQLGAIVCVVAGTLLYRWGITGTTDLKGDGIGVKFEVKNAAPGTVLALFGMIVMTAGLAYPARMDVAEPSASGSAAPPSASGRAAPPSASGSVAPPAAAKPATTTFVYGDTQTQADQLVERLRNLTIEPKAVAQLDSVVKEAERASACLPEGSSRGSFLCEVATAQGSSEEEARKALEKLQVDARKLP